MASEPKLSSGRVEKLLTKSIKQAVAQGGITSTRSGNKELSFLIKEVRSAPFDSEAQVQKVGMAIGEKITALSQPNSETDQRQNLDAGVIRTLRFKRDWSASFDIPEALPVEKTSKKSTKATQTVVTPPVKDKPKDMPGEDVSKERSPNPNSTPEDNTAEQESVDSLLSDNNNSDNNGETMPDSNADRVNEAAIMPETASTAPRSAEAEALLTDESDETQTMSSDEADSGAPEVALSDETTEVEDAAEAEVLERVNKSPGAGATTAAPVDPEAAAMARGATAPDGEK